MLTEFGVYVCVYGKNRKKVTTKKERTKREKVVDGKKM